MGFPYEFFRLIELDQCFQQYFSATDFYGPMCNALERETNTTRERINGGFCFNYDCQDGKVSKWKYRSVVQKYRKLYVDFAPSIMRGGKRNFDLDECRENLKEYEGFFVGDIFAPNTDKSKKIVPVYRVYTSNLLKCDLQSYNGFLEFARENNQA